MAKALTISEINFKKPEDSRLKAIEFAKIHYTPSDTPIRMVKALCICGNFITIRVGDLTNGHTKSCGCYNSEVVIKRNTKYSHHIPKLYHCYADMIKRCYDIRATGYKNYGGKGVSVCDEWKNNYQPFLDWSLTNGWKPGLQLDKDKKGNGKLYSPNTCCWITRQENQKYKITSKRYEYNG